MKTIKKIADGEKFAVREEEFTFLEKPVQGARVGKRGNDRWIESRGRFKLFTEESDLVKVLSLEKEGHFKWSRGELPYAAGDCFEVSAVGEYELNGRGTYLVIKK